MEINPFPDCDAINFEINLIFLMKPFLYIIKTSRQKFRYPENRDFKVKWKAFLIFFKGLLSQKIVSDL